ncbi:MAG: UDP-glucose dehydrogenase family protein [Armatimonadota bacterium]
MRICVFGTGYVGLVAGAAFSSTGNHVVCFDVDSSRVRRLQCGGLPIHEPGLDELVRYNSEAGRLAFSDDPAAATRCAQVVLVAVGTPCSDTGDPDMSQVWSAGDLIGRHMGGPTIVVVKSTVPVGTGDHLEQIISAQTSHPFEVVSNPEFLKEGDALNDFMKPARVVIGTDSPWAREVLRELYSPFMRTSERMLFMDRRSSELTKYASNAFLATRISFINQIACLCEHVGADVESVRRGMGSDPRIGNQFLFPGVGYGGSCFPKDVRALILIGRAHGCPLDIAEAVERVNQAQRDVFVGKIVGRFGDDLAGLTFAVWGLSFKPRTDDIREAPALTVIEALLSRGARVCAFDPVANAHARDYFGDRIALREGLYETLADADALVVMTEWQEFRHPDFEEMRDLMRRPVIFDGRNLYSPRVAAEHGFEYHGVGRPALEPQAAAGTQMPLELDAPVTGAAGQ